MAIVQLLLVAARPNFAGRKQKCYFNITCDGFLSVRRYWTEIRRNAAAGTTTEKRVCCDFSKKFLHRKVDSDKDFALLINRHNNRTIAIFSATVLSHFLLVNWLLNSAALNDVNLLRDL